MEYSHRPADFSSPGSQDYRQHTDDALDLSIRSRKEEAVIAQDCCTPPTDISLNHSQPSTSSFRPFIKYPHIPQTASVISRHPQLLLQPSNPVSPPLVPDMCSVPSPRYMPLHSVAIPSTSRDMQPAPSFPQYVMFHRTPSTEEPPTTQEVPTPGNSSSNYSLPGLSPSPLGLQLPAFQITGNDLPDMPVTAGNPAKKFTRPFNAIPVHLEEPSGATGESYTEYRNRVLAFLEAAKRNGESKKSAPVPKHTPSPQQSPSTEGTPSNGKDAAYLLKRKKNNAAAKRSRDLRRAKEDELAIRVSYLERENKALRCLLMQHQDWKYHVVCRNCRHKTF
ncbi:hypothetical protein B7P43_G00984 [Cryptotermes secundus]|uniref:BZIP domain-containing protein n=2 Tax=Cryptotermes secundus TaxID=105785 RepID=A0A2J7PFY8_9NEOP|nr:hypothetical protein B7P43_G00984 [Cryptotermes secundus]